MAFSIARVCPVEADDALAKAIEQLKTQPVLPADAGNVITPGGKIDQAILRALHAWLIPAFTLSPSLKRVIICVTASSLRMIKEASR